MDKQTVDQTNNINVADLVANIISTKNNNPLSIDQPSEKCILTKVYTAGCYTNASYIISDLHPYTINTGTHKDTSQIIKENSQSTHTLYDDEKKPLVSAVVFNQPQNIVIAFHGINFSNKAYHLKNFESDLTHTNWAPGLYHNGFCNLFNGILPKILSYLNEKNALNGEKKIQIYGHSMGGALSQLLTQYLQHTFKHVQTETIVFGCPKVMDPVAANAYNQKNNNRTLRIENPLDLAIYMPKQSMGYGNVNTSFILPSTHNTMARNHDLEGYLESILSFKEKLAKNNIQHISLEHYLQATKRFNILYPFTQTNTPIQVKNSTFSEFINLMTYNISKGLHSIINLLPFRHK